MPLISEINQRLQSWVRSVAGDVLVSMEAPNKVGAEVRVSLYLMEITRAALSRTDRDQILQFWLRYLVTSWATQIEEAHELLEKLILGAVENPEMQVEFEALPASAWAAFGLAPRPAFVLRIGVQHRRRERSTTTVSAPPAIKFTPCRRLSGFVLGLGNQPIAGARVEVAGLELVTRTDSGGRFNFHAVPVSPVPNRLRVNLKGESFTVEVDAQSEGESPVVVRWEPTIEK